MMPLRSNAEGGFECKNTHQDTDEVTPHCLCLCLVPGTPVPEGIMCLVAACFGYQSSNATGR